MCTCQIILYRHVPPCTRPPSESISYNHCPYAVRDPFTLQIISTCQNVIHLTPQGNPWPGYVLVHPRCSSGLCRLEDLNGQWICCRCHRGENTHVYCQQRKRNSPDSFCYHLVCGDCTKCPPS